MYYYSRTTSGFYSPVIHGAAIPADAVEITDDQHAALLAGQSAGKLISADAAGAPILLDRPAPTPQELQAACVAAVQAELDRQANVRGYDNIVSACSYAAQAVGTPFQAEGAAFLDWRARVWHQAYATLGAVEAGEQPMPSPQQAVADMPPLVLPS